MRFLIHDFAGHPFQVQLSRELAIRGHSVTHVYPLGLSGPKGQLEKLSSDSDRLRFEAIELSGHFRKYSPHRRFIAQRQYARDLKRTIQRELPDVVLSGNTPIDVQAELLWFCRRKRIGFVHWVQDVYCQAIEFFLRQKLPGFSKVLSGPFRALEKAVAAHSNSTVVISPDFRSLLLQWGVPDKRIEVVENWAPLAEVEVLSRDNSWSAALNLGTKPILLYSGTLGLKHRPDLLYSLAKDLGDDCRVVVLSEGVGRTYLEKLPPLSNLTLLGFQPYDRLSEVLASADLLLATLEADAGQFAVPSKILTYLCAGRALLFAGPKENLAAKIILRSGGGVVIDPDDTSAWISAAKGLIFDASRRERLATNARRYAEHAFDIQMITSQFEAVLGRVAQCR